MEPYTLLKNILYINLDHREDRKRDTTTEFIKLSQYCAPHKLNHPERVNAIKMEHGAIGCALSHIKCLELAYERKYPYVFICEDDIEFLRPDYCIKSIKEFEENPPPNWNVFIVGGNIIPPYRLYNNSSINVFNCQTTTGYITHYSYYQTLINNFRTGIDHLIRDTKNERLYAIDQYWKLLQQSGTWYMIYPSCVVQRAGYSDIEKRDVDYSNLMLDTEKRYLFDKNTRRNKMEFHK